MHSSGLKKIGSWIKENYPSGCVIATRRQGAIPFYAEMKSLDILGITDKKIAKVLFEEKNVVKANTLTREHIMDRNPDLVILFSSNVSDKGWIFNHDFPKERLYHVEYLIYEEAKKGGYVLAESRPFGHSETALFLEKGKAR
jgi:hypothetical protein